jgi:hypothetical protein
MILLRYWRASERSVTFPSLRHGVFFPECCFPGPVAQLGPAAWLSSHPNAGSLALTCAVARVPNVGWIIVEPSERELQSLTLARVCRLRAPLAEPRGATRESRGPLPSRYHDALPDGPRIWAVGPGGAC